MSAPREDARSASGRVCSMEDCNAEREEERCDMREDSCDWRTLRERFDGGGGGMVRTDDEEEDDDEDDMGEEIGMTVEDGGMTAEQRRNEEKMHERYAQLAETP